MSTRDSMASRNGDSHKHRSHVRCVPRGKSTNIAFRTLHITNALQTVSSRSTHPTHTGSPPPCWPKHNGRRNRQQLHKCLHGPSIYRPQRQNPPPDWQPKPLRRIQHLVRPQLCKIHLHKPRPQVENKPDYTRSHAQGLRHEGATRYVTVLQGTSGSTDEDATDVL